MIKNGALAAIDPERLYRECVIIFYNAIALSKNKCYDRVSAAKPRGGSDSKIWRSDVLKRIARKLIWQVK